MSPRAAWRLESLGFREVFDYVPGKKDWLSAGLSTEGTNRGRPRAGSVARPDVPTCRVDERIADVRERVSAAGWETCIVVNDERVVFGLLRGEELSRGSDEPVGEIMRPGPSTYRPHVPIDELAARMVEEGRVSAPITTSDGRLVGLVRREDAVAAARRLH